MGYFGTWAEMNIPKGKGYAIQKETLCTLTGKKDREVRKFIQKARDEGVMIVNDMDSNGYYISDDLDEIERQYRRDKSRALSILKRLKSMRKILKENGRNV